MRCSRLPLAALLLVGACASETNDNTRPDATIDSGTVPTSPDTGVVADAGPADSGAAPGDCNAIDGSGCGAQTCVYIGDPIGVQCRDLAMPAKGHEESCNRQLHDCAPGFACLLFQGEMDGPKCRKVCMTSSNAECQGLVGVSNKYTCGFRLDQQRSLGACEPDLPDCLPFNDTCDAGEYCQSAGGQLRCLPDGVPDLGDSCRPLNRCQRGSICVMGVCREPCDPAGGACTSPNTTCTVVEMNGITQPFGVCG